VETFADDRDGLRGVTFRKMRFRFQPWQLAVLVIALCVGAVIFAQRQRSARTFDAAGLLECLPPSQATHVYINFDTLRRSGLLDLLAGSKAAEEPDYRRFVEQTGFDYRTDLDAVAMAFLRGDVYFTLHGRFEWKRLAEYARSQGGACRNAICDMPAAKAGRHISFYPLKSDVLALSVSNEERGVVNIGPNQWKQHPTLPAEPVWISAPSFAFTDVDTFPAGTHSFLSPLSQAQTVTFAVGPEGQRLQIRLDATCATPEAASTLANQLTNTTDLLKKMLDRQHMTPNPRDLSGPLVAGSFQQQDRHVAGTWPIERAFVEALATGQVQ
jgi:hypothetical protein